MEKQFLRKYLILSGVLTNYFFVEYRYAGAGTSSPTVKNRKAFEPRRLFRYRVANLPAILLANTGVSFS